MLEVKNYMRNRKDRVEFISDMTYFNEHCHSMALNQFLKESNSFFETDSLISYVNSKFKVIDFALLLTIMCDENDGALFLENEQTTEGNLLICDILSAFGFETSLDKNEKGDRIIIKILNKPEVFDFSVFPVLSGDEWYEIVKRNHTGHEISKPTFDDEEIKEKQVEETSENSKSALTSVSYIDGKMDFEDL